MDIMVTIRCNIYKNNKGKGRPALIPNEATTDPISTLSANGSRYVPSTVCCCVLLAKYPSNQSVRPETARVGTAMDQLLSKISNPMMGPDIRRARERLFGRLKTSE